MSEQTMLDEWCDQYIDEEWNHQVTFEGYKELALPDGFRMGMITCYFYKKSDKVVGKIWLDDDHSKCPTLFRDAVLWHEFCHYWDAVELMHADHCENFHKKKLKKPLYAFGDVVLKLIGWIWFD